MTNKTAPKDRSSFCLLCNKEFANPRNLKRHTNYAHKLCEAPTYVCNFCHTGFVNWDDYEKHHSNRLMKTFSRKTKKRKVKAVEMQIPLQQTEMAEPMETLPNLDMDLMEYMQ